MTRKQTGPNRQQRAALAAATLEILDCGQYSLAGESVDITASLRDCVARTRVYQPDDFAELLAQPKPELETRVEVTGETTLAALQRLVAAGVEDPLALNFASARNPGGGFVKGSQAQEESLARASGLYAALTSAPDYYAANAAHGSPLYTDWAIYSPRVPVFRDDSGELVRPYQASFVTMPAPNANALRQHRDPDIERVPATLARRAEHVLAIALANGHRAVVLGAWGCGVFGNDPTEVAAAFRASLRTRWARAFERVVFAVLDHSDGQAVRGAFVEEFGTGS